MELNCQPDQKRCTIMINLKTIQKFASLINNEIICKNRIPVLFIDQAFDTINHSKLLKNPDTIGIRGQLLKLLMVQSVVTLLRVLKCFMIRTKNNGNPSVFVMDINTSAFYLKTFICFFIKVTQAHAGVLLRRILAFILQACYIL